MSPRATLSLLACIVAGSLTESHSFGSKFFISFLPSKKSLKNKSSLPVVTDEAPEDILESQQDSRLRLGGEFKKKTNPLPLNDKLDEFFRLTSTRNLLITGGGDRPCSEIDATPELLEDWEKACTQLGAETPDASKDSIVTVTTGDINFPGLHLKSLARIGTKLVEEKNDSSAGDGPTCPYYELTLIGDERQVSGLPPVVWIFNQLTGGGKNDSSSQTSTSSLTRVGYERTEGDRVIFTFSGFIYVNIKFPAILLKILPTNREKAEETGGKAVTRAVLKDVNAALETLENEYQKFLD